MQKLKEEEKAEIINDTKKIGQEMLDSKIAELQTTFEKTKKTQRKA